MYRGNITFWFNKRRKWQNRRYFLLLKDKNTFFVKNCSINFGRWSFDNNFLVFMAIITAKKKVIRCILLLNRLTTRLECNMKYKHAFAVGNLCGYGMIVMLGSLGFTLLTHFPIRTSWVFIRYLFNGDLLVLWCSCRCPHWWSRNNRRKILVVATM